MQQVLAGRYRLERQLGKGGMGSVWLAEHLALRSWVAVKLMDPAIAATPEGAERFRREAQAAASLRSAHVVQVLDYGLHEATPFLVMELLQGESLAACLERERRLAPERTLAIMTQVSRALGRAHQAGIVHRDLKPDNVFLVREDDQELVKILDFGIAKTPTAQFGGMETRTGVTMGTPYYMSPEQVEGKKALDHRTDLWAMAVITCECMTGVRPFDGETYGELLLNICARPIPVPSSQGPVPQSFDAWFFRATSRDPEQRFASAQDLATTLRDVVSGTAPGVAFSTGTQPGNPPFAAAATAGPPQYGHSGAYGGPPPANTSQPIEVSKPSGGRSVLPWVLLAGVLVVGGAGAAAVFVLRTKPSQPVVTAASTEAIAATAPALSAPAAATPASETVPAPPPSTASAPAVTPTSVAPPSRETTPPTPVHGDKPKPPPLHPPGPPPPTPTPSANTAPKTGQCFSDPFSGQIRPAGGSRAPAGPTFPCTQDPFTGKYKKL